MSIFKANKKYLSLAQMYMEQAKGIQEQQQDIDFGRQLLSNIRQYRIQQAALDIQDLGREGVSVSGFQSARQGLQTQLTQPYQYAVDDAERQEEIAELQTKANQALKKYKSQAKTARTTGYITAIALGAVGGFAGGLVASGAAASASTAATAGAITAGGAAAGAVGANVLGAGLMSAAGTGADRNYYRGVIQGTTTAAIAAGTIGYGVGAAGFTPTTTFTLADGGATMTAATGAAEGWSASSVLSASYTVFNRLGKDMQYLAQDPKLSVQLRGFA